MIRQSALFCFMFICQLSAQENAYIQEHGKSKIIPSQEAYSDFQQAPIPSSILGHINVIITSEKPIKVEAAKALFEQNPRYGHLEKTFHTIKVNSDIAHQPIDIMNGRIGALNRLNNTIRELKKQKRPLSDFYICSIENYFETKEQDTPCDHAFIIVQNPNGEVFEAVSDGVTINKNVFAEAIKKAQHKESGYSQTIGIFLHEHYGFDGSDWFGAVLGDPTFNRRRQILTTLDKGAWF